MRVIKKAKDTISRPCVLCGKVIRKGQQYQYDDSIGTYKHLKCKKGGKR